MNYASSSGAAEEVADQIKQSGGDAITVQADLSKKENIERSAHKSFYNSLFYTLHSLSGMHASACFELLYVAVMEAGACACRLFKEAVDSWGTVDVLVNNAGITRDTLIMRMKPEQWQAVIDTNLTGVFYAIQVSGIALSQAPSDGASTSYQQPQPCCA